MNLLLRRFRHFIFQAQETELKTRRYFNSGKIARLLCLNFPHNFKKLVAFLVKKFANMLNCPARKRFPYLSVRRQSHRAEIGDNSLI